jgi:hypothetical protein
MNENKASDTKAIVQDLDSEIVLLDGEQNAQSTDTGRRWIRGN